MKKIELKYFFLLPIILTMIVSISHVMVWYSLSNPFVWSIFMSISIEVGAMAALVAATKKIKGGVWVVFSIVTFIQMIGNIFFSFKEINSNGELFKSWVELTSPVWESLGSDTSDIVAQKRWLAFLEGGLLPIISLTSLHFFIKYEDNKEEKESQVEVTKEIIVEKEVPVEVIKEVIVEEESPVEIVDEVVVDEEVPVELNENTTITDDESTENVRRLVYTKQN